MYNRQSIWNQNYAKASCLVQKLYNTETNNGPELIKSVLNEKDSDKIIIEVQKILQQDREIANKKMADIIAEAESFGPHCKDRSTERGTIRALKSYSDHKNTVNPNCYSHNDLAFFDLAYKYEKYRCKKKLIKNTENQILEELANQKIEVKSTIEGAIVL